MFMRESKGPRLLALSRTLFILFGIVACYFRLINVEWFTQASVFIMAPWAVVTIMGELVHRQITRTAYHALLFAMSGIFLLTSLYNRGIFAPGLAVLIAFCAVVWLIYHICRDTGDAKRDRLRRVVCLAAVALCLAAFLPLFVSFYNGNGWKLPWTEANAPQTPANMQAMLAFAYARNWVLSDLSVVAYICSVMLIVGIAPKDIDTRYLRREGRIACGLIVALSFLLIIPAVYSVFIGRPVFIDFLPEKMGVGEIGRFNDRIRALQHPNGSSHFALMGLFSAIYCMYGHRKWWIKALLTVACVVFMIAMAHCQSRTSNVALGLGFGAMVFRWVYLRYETRRWRIPVGLTAAVLIVPLTLLSIDALYSVDLRITMGLNAAIVKPVTEQTEAEPQVDEAPSDSQTVEAPAEPTPTVAPTATPDPNKIAITEETSQRMMVTRTVTDGADLLSNGRGVVWRESVYYLIHNPRAMILGMGAGRIVDRIDKYNNSALKKTFNLHNGFLETLARGGVFMLLCLIAALVLLVRPTARLLTERDPDDPGGFVFVAFIGVPLAITMAEALLFVEVSLFNLVFFYAASRAVKHSEMAQIK